MLQGARYTETWFGTKAEAKHAEAKKREEVQNPQPSPQTPTDITFLELLNRRLDHVKAYKSDRYYTDYTYHAKRWVKAWGALGWREVSTEMIEAFLRKRAGNGSAHAANKDLRHLKAVFGFGVKRRWIDRNPCQGIEFFPVVKNVKYVPPEEHIARVIASAKPDDVDYLVAIKDTMARVGEINRLTWEDVRFEERCVLLYTRKKRGGNLTPRKVTMTERLFRLLALRHQRRDPAKPWVFWHRHWNRKKQCWIEGPYTDRKGLMRILCGRAGVPYFRYHALRHAGASLMDRENVNTGAIQQILGHEKRSTTEIYLHTLSRAEREAIAIYEKADDSLTEVLRDFHTQIHTQNRPKKEGACKVLKLKRACRDSNAEPTD